MWRIQIFLSLLCLCQPTLAYEGEDEALQAGFLSDVCSCTCGREGGWACGGGAACYAGGKLGCACQGFGYGEYAPSGRCIAEIITGNATQSTVLCPSRKPPSEADKRVLAMQVQKQITVQNQALWDMLKWDTITWTAVKADEAGKLSQMGLSIFVPSAWMARYGTAAVQVGKAILALDAARAAADFRGQALASGASEGEAAACALVGGAVGGLITHAGQNLPFVSSETDQLMRLGWRWLKSGKTNRAVITGFISYVGGTTSTTMGQMAQEKLGEAAKEGFFGAIGVKPVPAPDDTIHLDLPVAGVVW